MAQQTFNVQGMGNIPLFALESTAQQIAGAIQTVAVNTQILASINAGQKYSGTQQQIVASMTKNTNQGIHELHHIGIAGLNKSFLYGTNLITTSLGKKLGELSNLSKGMDRLGTLFKPTATGGIFDSLTKRLGVNAASNQLNAFGKILGKVGPWAALAGTAIGGLLNVAEDYRKNLLDLTNYGTGFGVSILDLETKLASAGVTIDDYSILMQEHGVAVRNLGTTSEEAAIRFTRLAQTVRDTAKDFGAYGLTSQELNQFTGEYLELQRQRGITGEDAALGVEKAFRTLAIQTDAMSRQTGRDRREALRAGMQAGGERGIARRARALGEGGEGFTANVQSLAAMMTQTMGESAPDLVRAMTQAAAMGTGLELTDMRQFLAMSGEAGMRLNEIIKNIDQMSPEEMARAYEDFGKQLGRQRDQRSQQGQEIQAMTNEGVRRYADLMVDYKNISNLAEQTKEFQKQSSDAQKRASEATDAYVKDFPKILGAYEPAMKDLEASLKGLRAKFVNWVMPSIAGFSTDLIGLSATIRKWSVGGGTSVEGQGIGQIGAGGRDLDANIQRILEEIKSYMAQSVDSSNALTGAINKIGRQSQIGGKAMFGELTL
tara:strand:+ start:22 stop:1830 length:1809 start_codon:yes stop_codon:yes gene_type:complete